MWGTGLKEGRHLQSSLQSPWQPWCPLSHHYKALPTFTFRCSPLAVAMLDPGMPFLASEALSAHLEDVWGSWLDAGCLRISIVRLRGPIRRTECVAAYQRPSGLRNGMVSLGKAHRGRNSRPCLEEGREGEAGIRAKTTVSFNHSTSSIPG